MTLRVRFALWILVLLVAGLAGFGVLVYLKVADWLAASVDDGLRLSASQVVETLDVDKGRIDLSDNPVTQDTPFADELRARGLTIQLFDTGGAPIKAFGPYRGIALNVGTLAAVLDGHPALETRVDPSRDGSIRVLTQALTNAGSTIGVVQISESLRTMQDTLQGLLTALLIGSPILIITASVGGYLLVGRALAPIDEITQTARRISAQDLSGRINLPGPRDEVGRLATTFDDMLARLEGAFRRERRFTTDAAHELRTPLTAMQAILTVTAQRRRTPAEYEEALTDLGDETAQLGALTDDLLRLARAEQPLSMAETIDLTTLLPDVADTLRPLAEAKGIILTCTAPSDLTLRGDTEALIRLFLNLVDNAIKYTPTGGAVNITAEAGSDVLRVVVADTGEGISTEHLPHVFERFYRADQARTTAGTGLGLAISSEIVHAHGGTISAESNLGRGSTFTVGLPRALA